MEPRKQLSAVLNKIDGAYAHATIRAYRADFTDLIAFCEERRQQPLPASPQAVATFIEELIHRGKKSATIRRALAGISAIHRFSGHLDPTKDLDVRLAVRRMHRQIGRHQRQALGINRRTLNQLVRATDNSLRGKRDRALLLVAYDTLCRRSELLALQVENYQSASEGRADYSTLLLRRSKTDPESVGRWLRLSPRASQALEQWLKTAKLTSGPLFRGIKNNNALTQHMDVGQVTRIYKRLAQKALLNEATIRGISSHSLRVGAAQDLLLDGASLPLIMHKGRWTKPDTVMRYVERLGTPR